MSKDLRDLIKSYLDDARLMQLATSVDDQPWVCNVWFASDDALNIYWFSSTTRRHSHEVLKNARVAAAMALPFTPDDVPRGLQLQGNAELLDDEADVAWARSHFQGRIFPESKIDEFINHPDRPHRFYRIRPTQFVLFDAVNFPEDPRQTLDLDA